MIESIVDSLETRNWIWKTVGVKWFYFIVNDIDVGMKIIYRKAISFSIRLAVSSFLILK